MDKILVTGGAGFIGSHLVDELLHRGYHVVVLDDLSNGSMERLSMASKNKRFQFIHGSVLNPNDCSKAIKGCKFIYHLACLGVRHSLHSPLENHKVNSEGTLILLEEAKRSKISHFFYISTSEVYGRTNIFPIHEDAILKPLTVYGSSKLSGENYALNYHECYDLPTTVLRIFNNYGPRAHFEGDAGEIIPRSIIQVLNGKQPTIFGDGSITRDFFFVRDTAKVLCDLLGYTNLTRGEVINIGTGEERSIKSIVELILKLMNKTNISIDYQTDRPADVPRLWVNNTKIKTFGLPLYSNSFEDNMIETINYYINLAKLKHNELIIPERNWIL
jgi:UDP-glucose 4-epimerase